MIRNHDLWNIYYVSETLHILPRALMTPMRYVNQAFCLRHREVGDRARNQTLACQTPYLWSGPCHQSGGWLWGTRFQHNSGRCHMTGARRPEPSAWEHRPGNTWWGGVGWSGWKDFTEMRAFEVRSKDWRNRFCWSKVEERRPHLDSGARLSGLESYFCRFLAVWTVAWSIKYRI